MLPFITVGEYRLATYGLMMVAGLYVGYCLLRAELHRRRLPLDARRVVWSIGLAGLLASKLYLGLEDPARFVRDPAFLLSRAGYTFYGAVLGGVGMVFLLARYYRIASLRLFDAVSTGAAIGYGIGRLGCLLAGDGDYGTPTSLPWGMTFPHGLVPTLVPVHPTPIYEFLGAALIAAYLWRLGARHPHDPRSAGTVFARYLILTGIARFGVEFLRLNPPILWGLSNAQCVALLSIIGGLALQTVVWRRYRTPATFLPAATVITRP